MTAYVIADVGGVTDAERIATYREMSTRAAAAGGGRFLARGGQIDVLEGNWQPERIVIIRFDDMESARRYYDSELYRQARQARAGATARFNMICVEGLADEEKGQ
ncbi:MAG: DUF1330 domain-containing protein [Lautropia sp.]|nr:DUF1330 domain-containing protein [Lautropia sp.]